LFFTTLLKYFEKTKPKINFKATLNFQHPVPLLHGCSFTAFAKLEKLKFRN
jgi:hypothetical protein